METSLETEIESRTGPVWVPESAYVHVPFCAHKCGYCDFASVAGQDEQIENYLDALEAEMCSILKEPCNIKTLFVGGGTPTYLSASQLQTLLTRLKRWFDPGKIEEFTVESNPNTLTVEKVSILADHGVNRLSLGAQSFHPHLLSRLERNHDPASVPRAMEMARQRIDNVSLDLIFGVPDQTFEEWRSDLQQALALAPDHLSTYSLTYEKGTRLWSQRRLGIIEPVDEESELRMYEHAIDRLTGEGWEHYEISNFARPSGAGQGGRGQYRHCQHNLTYWANQACYGFGTGAAAYVGGVRTLNTREVGAYISRCRSDRSPVTQTEELDPEARARETAMLNLRRLAGLDREAFVAQTGFEIDTLAGSALAEFVELGLLEDDGHLIRLTRSGFPVADSVLRMVL